MGGALILTGEKKLRLLHMAHIHWYNAEVQYALDLMKELRSRGHDMAFFTCRSSLGANEARRAWFRTYEEAGFNAKGLMYPTALAATRRLLRLLDEEKPDAVLLYRSEGLPLILWACRRRGIPLIRVRGDMRPVRGTQLNRRLYTRWLDAVVSTNSAIERSLRARLGEPNRLVTIHGGVDTKMFTPFGPESTLRQELGLSDSCFLAGIVGRMDQVKGHEVFIDAARQVLEYGAEVHFAVLTKEYSPLFDKLRHKVEKDSVLNGHISFLGHRTDLPDTLRNFDLGVITSLGSEANCRVALEWMASGVPVIGTRIGVQPDIIEEFETGFLVEPGDSRALAGKIIYLAENANEARYMGAAARRRIEKRFDISITADKYLALLENILGREKRHESGASSASRYHGSLQEV
jgi:glycosyltransferase involved in cell wall biosynthesis